MRTPTPPSKVAGPSIRITNHCTSTSPVSSQSQPLAQQCHRRRAAVAAEQRGDPVLRCARGGGDGGFDILREQRPAVHLHAVAHPAHHVKLCRAEKSSIAGVIPGVGEGGGFALIVQDGAGDRGAADHHLAEDPIADRGAVGVDDPDLRTVQRRTAAGQPGSRGIGADGVRDVRGAEYPHLEAGRIDGERRWRRVGAQTGHRECGLGQAVGG